MTTRSPDERFQRRKEVCARVRDQRLQERAKGPVLPELTPPKVWISNFGRYERGTANLHLHLRGSQKRSARTSEVNKFCAVFRETQSLRGPPSRRP